MKPENQSTESESYLDLDLRNDEKVFNRKLYDKRDAFPFSVVRMPHYQSNMPSTMFYSTITAEVLRICRTTLKFSDFKNSVEKLLVRMTKQGAKVWVLNFFA